MNKITKCFPPLALCLALSGCGDKDELTLADWKKLSESARNNISARHFAKEPELVKKCIDRIAAREGAEQVKVLDAGNNCLLGLELRERNEKSKK